MRYLAGSRSEALRRMCYHAIRDQESLIDAYSNNSNSPNDPEAVKVVADCKSNIADYRRICKSLNRKSDTGDQHEILQRL